LRGFLRLDARALKDGIPLADVERQEETVLRALEMLEDRPGLVLADEVGMGKTYEALGIAAATRHLDPTSRIVVVTPGPDLNNKWSEEFARFKEMYDFGGEVCTAHRLREFVGAVREHPIVVAPVTMFQSGRGSGSQTYLLSLYFHWKDLHGHTANAIMERFRDGDFERVDVRTEQFLGMFGLNDVSPYLASAFRRATSGSGAGLDDLYEKGGLAAFENQSAVRNALYHARFVLTGQLMPTIDLLIVDEAHKLKNPGALRTRAMRQVFERRFRKALFLTATPFQLDVGELREIFALFADAADAPGDLVEQVEGLLATVRDYQQQYDAFQATWSSLDPIVAARFRALYDRGAALSDNLDDPSLTVVARQIAGLRAIKEGSVEPGFRKWMIRSLREDKRTYRQHLRKDIVAEGAGALPFLIYERFIAELYAQGRQTHRAAVEINMVSSYAAASDGAILETEEGIPAAAAVYRDLLRRTLEDLESGATAHPKLRTAIADALDAADRGDKTLVFCSRIATLEQLRRELDDVWQARVLDRWRRVYPGEGADEIFDTREGDERQRGRHSQLQARFHRAHDALYLALRESYLRTVVPIADESLQQLPRIVDRANDRLRAVRVGKTSVDRVDYQIAKRCVEQAVVEILGKAADRTAINKRALENLRSPDFVGLGLDLEADEFENDPVGDASPSWEISERIARVVIGPGGSLWEGLIDLLDALDVALRVRVVEQLARYLTYKQVPFLADLLTEAHAMGVVVDPVESAGLLEAMPRFWQTESGTRWVGQLRAFLVYFVERDPRQQLEILDGPIKTGEFARHTRDGESRERLREAFNTPLYPMILIANEVMQEGLDLHKHCRRIVHHDLVWNPAQVEQRIGRIDRLGSMTHRLRKLGNPATLDVLYPLIRGTIDVRLFRTVKTREKWLEFLLGAAPSFTDYAFGEADPPPLPEQLGVDLAIGLGPTKET
jgi:superfamily II DNA or RNA helicase